MAVAISKRDYSLVGEEGKHAEERGLASAQWYASPISRKRMKELMQRRNGPAIRDTLMWFALLIITGGIAYYTWGTWWCIPAFMAYGTLYGSVSDSRWHECGHGTAFKTPWMNEVVYQIACFMVLRQPTTWRWSHTRHHTDTIIVGRDPEIAAPRPPDLMGMALGIFSLKSGPRELRKLFLHCFGKLDIEEATFIPETERGKVFRTARIWVLIYAAVIALAFARHTHPAPALHRFALILRRLVVECFWFHPARRAGRRRSGSPPELPHRLHESRPAFPVLEHELSRGTSHVPHGSLSCPAGAARGNEG